MNKYSDAIPQTILLEFLELGLIRKKSHLNFVSRMKSVVSVEAYLRYWAHVSPTKMGDKLLDYLGKPLPERMKILDSMKGKEFFGMVSLWEKRIALNQKLLLGDKSKTTKIKSAQIDRTIKEKENTFLIGLKSAMISKSPLTSIKNLHRASSPNKNLSKRELNILQDAHDRLKSIERTKMKRNLRL